MTLEQTAKAGESLLNFEDSIGNQLKAELLTGKQLNLERARAAALQGDQATLAEELSKNIGTAAEFTKMNVLQQKSLAESVGMTADELSNTLRRREEAIASGKSLAQVTEEEAKQALERQNVQDKFNNAMLKLQDIVGNLVAGPFGQLLDIVSNIANVILKIIQPFASVASAILSPILGGINSVLGGIGSADDMVGYGARTLITPTGAVALNNNDTVIAGTNLFKGDDVASFPKGALKLGGGGSGRLEELMSTLIDVTKSTKIGVNLDGRAVGTGIVRATYQSA